MLDALERTGWDIHRTRATPAPLKPMTRPAGRQPRQDERRAAAVGTRPEQDDGLIAAAGPIMMAAYGLVLAVAVLTFKGSTEALLALAVCMAFTVVFFGVPLAMVRIRARHDARWQKAVRNTGTVETYTGRMDRNEAVLHMVIVPVLVSIAFVCFAVIWVLVRP